MRSKYFLGCSGFYYNHWKGIFYPEDLSKNKWLEFYMEHFNTVEINSTFYRFPKDKTVKNWASKAKSNFKYSLKVNKMITHNKKFIDTKDLVEQFYSLASLLNDKLGCILFQLPPSIHKDINKLNEIISQLNPSYKNVIEFRHKSWWDPEVYKILEKNNITFCSTSSPKLPEDLIITSNIVYIRFHGKSRWFRHNYTDDELKIWVDEIKKISSEIKEIYIYFNNDFEGYAINNCKNLFKLLNLE